MDKKIATCKVFLNRDDVVPGSMDNVVYIVFKKAIPVDDLEYEEFKTLIREAFEQIFEEFEEGKINVFPNEDFLEELKYFLTKYTR